jgi:uncharacterized protein (TIGR01777 family)
MATICITGGTGLLGKALTRYLSAKGHAIIILSRSAKANSNDSVTYQQWDPEKGTISKDAIAQSDYIFHLAGAGVADQRWTKKRKEEIRKSRVDGSALLLKALTEIPNKVQAVISTSAIGWYGPDQGKAFIETDPSAPDFLGTTCKEWEESIEPVTALGKRLVKLRMGIVLSNEGGAFKEFKTTLKFGLASILGTGKQMISWIHIFDVVRLYEYAMENDQLSGVFNAVAPKPVSNKDLTLTLAKKMRGRAFITLPVPSFVLKIILGEMSIEVLKSTTASAVKIQHAGFQFSYPTIEAAVNELIP